MSGILRIRVARANELCDRYDFAGDSYNHAAKAIFRYGGRIPSRIQLDLWEKTVDCYTIHGEECQQSRINAANVLIRLGRDYLIYGEHKIGAFRIIRGLELFMRDDINPRNFSHVDKALRKIEKIDTQQ